MQTTTLDEHTARGTRSDALSASDLLRVLLKNRGITDTREAEAFLAPDYEAHTHDPFLLADMERAVARIMRAIAAEEHIILYTDYDTDGLPAGIVLRDMFRALGYTHFENYIPHRHDEGYGLNDEAIDAFAARGAGLVITADCGISDNAIIARAQDIGIDVIVTDHHVPHANLPPAYAVINPKRADESYPFGELCGAGVAFKLAQALFLRARKDGYTIREGQEKWLLDMVGIATLCDMVPLVGENRVLARFGLLVLRKTRRPGLTAFFAEQNMAPADITEDDVGFVIGPRINVAGRMDSPDKAFRFLGADTREEANAVIRELNHLNDQRKGLVASIVKEARARLREMEERRVVVIGNTRWHPGVLGLAANTLMAELRKPVFVWGEGGDGMLKGSCRSDGSVHVVELMEYAADVLAGFGGHHAAGGFSIARERIHELQDALESALDSVPKHEPTAAPFVDAALPIEAATWDTYRVIEQLAPFGEANPKPLFSFKGVQAADVQWFGKQKEHVKILVGPHRVPAVRFFADKQAGIPKPGEYFSFTAHIEKNVFRRRAELRLRVVTFAADGV